MADATELSHYTNYPMCGYCSNAWDIIYGRQRTIISCERWLSYCKWGGCDPEVWEHIDERTGWPIGMKIDKATGWPKCFTDIKATVLIPEYDNRVYHMRENSADNAPWRKVSERLRQAAIARKGKIKNIDLKDVDFGDDEDFTDEDLFGPYGDTVVQHMQPTDLDDPDLW